MPADFPPAPWDLRGQGWLTVWTAPRSAFPLHLPGVVPLSVFGRTLVVSAFVDYRPPGLLSYHELMTAVVVRRGFRLGLSITDIWVDDEQSMNGARAMWGIPKELAEFELTADPLTASASTDSASAASPAAPDAAATIASAAERPRKAPGLPVRLATSVWQSLHGNAHRTTLRTSARVRPTRLRWRITPGGRLGGLTTAKPLLHLAVANLRMRFG